MKIICIGRNYAAHAAELNNPVPTTPLLFLKPSTALLTDNKPFYYPSFTKDLHYEVELVLKICKNGKHIQPAFAHQYYQEITVGIDFTARDLQEQCKQKGHPWEVAKAFDHSAVVGQFISLAQAKADEGQILFSLSQNGKIVQQGDSREMITSFDALICYASTFFTLQKGDLIFTGTPKGVGPVQIGDELQAKIGEQNLLQFAIK
jgi:2-keto-4-pentenoate hydratase/2-oxohepta-3-ene-1,7-dioic acid hydratase in catechol pathway